MIQSIWSRASVRASAQQNQTVPQEGRYCERIRLGDRFPTLLLSAASAWAKPRTGESILTVSGLGYLALRLKVETDQGKFDPTFRLKFFSS